MKIKQTGRRSAEVRLTTPFGKKIGIHGWTDYRATACAAGWVEHVAKSTDGIRTVDMRLCVFTFNGQCVALEGQCFIRAEICRKVRLENDKLPKIGRWVRIQGKLMWDGDGWLEIHPQRPDDIDTDLDVCGCEVEHSHQ